jgi:hypothetical protein
LRAPLLACLLATLPAAAAGQRAHGLDARNQVALEVGYVAGGLSYARRIGATPFSAGAGVWGAWEPPNSFGRDILEPIGLQLFGRYRPAPWLHADLGVTGARYQWADDCSGCSGTFVGVRSAVLVGHGIVSIGPELSAGWANDERYGSEFGILLGGQVRLVLGWGP